MPPIPRIPARIPALITAALLLPACSSPQPTARDTTEEPRYLTVKEVAQLFATDEGRETLRALDEGSPRILFDGQDRFVEIDRTYTTEGRVPSLSMHFGWLHPDYAVGRSIRILGTQPHDDIQLAFTEDTLVVTITSPGAAPRDYPIAWPHHKMSQWGSINHATGQHHLGQIQ